ncbi:MAG: phosphonate metabolism protein PhnM [Candidatus Puniceispirillum sp. TMED52]|nr:MAG: phosphonate metabolism protein PhnM [Candidatus Puniceispirillum sp. TMED52]
METILANAKLLSGGEEFRGAVIFEDGVIKAIDGGGFIPIGAIDCEGDYISPGLVELHTDNLERHLQPRPGVDWPFQAAVIAHDRELASTGITTVFDAVRVGSIPSNKKAKYRKYARQTATQINDLARNGAMKISHFIHLRAELCTETMADELDEFSEQDMIKMISIMDHTPGQRQFRDVSKLVEYLSDKHNMNDKEVEAHFEKLRGFQRTYGSKHRRYAVEKAKSLGVLLASHDDTTEQDVDESALDGITLAEFPTTEEAAYASRQNDIVIMMGAPNLVRGGSHSGNVAASELHDKSLLDILSSDYVPSSLLLGAVILGLRKNDLAAGLRTVTQAPSEAAGFSDRGLLEAGRRADLVRFSLEDGSPRLKSVWCEGKQVA